MAQQKTQTQLYPQTPAIMARGAGGTTPAYYTGGNAAYGGMGGPGGMMSMPTPQYHTFTGM